MSNFLFRHQPIRKEWSYSVLVVKSKSLHKAWLTFVYKRQVQFVVCILTVPVVSIIKARRCLSSGGFWWFGFELFWTTGSFQSDCRLLLFFLNMVKCIVMLVSTINQKVFGILKTFQCKNKTTNSKRRDVQLKCIMCNKLILSWFIKSNMGV